MAEQQPAQRVQLARIMLPLEHAARSYGRIRMPQEWRIEEEMMLEYLTFRPVGVVLLENSLLVYCTAGAFILRFHQSPFRSPDGSWLFLKAILIAVIYQLFLHLADVYDFRRTRTIREFGVRLGLSVLLASLFLSTLYYLVPTLMHGRDLFPISLLVSSVFLIIWHALLRFYFGVRGPRSNVLILGTGRLAWELAREVKCRPEMGIGIAGFLEDDPGVVGVDSYHPQVLGLYEDLPQIMGREKVDRIVVELVERRGRLPVESLLAFKTAGVEIEDATTFYERITGKIAVQNLKPSWIIFNSGFKLSRRVLQLQRMLSFLISLLLLLLLSPVILLLMLLIKLDSAGPVFEGQERVGREGRLFTQWKFRSGHQAAEVAAGSAWPLRIDRRPTRIGVLLRWTRLEDLPQLFNVLRGEMNIVGPRPERPHFVDEVISEIPFYGIRHSVRPGITGWAQIKFESANTLEGAMEKLQYDLFYIKNLSLFLDFLVILETIKTALVRRGS